MFKLLFAATLVASLLCAGAATAAGPPIANETIHFADSTSSDVGLNCATGSTTSRRTITSTGVLRLLVLADGSARLHGLFRGNVVFDDIPAGAGDGDGVADAEATFLLALGEMVLPKGNAVYSEIFSGTTTALASGTELRLHVTYKLVLDPAGAAKVSIFRITCE